VIVKKGACVDTSDCFSIVINNVGLNSTNISNTLEIYPNPTSNILNIKSLDNHQSIKNIEILDITGKSILKRNFENENFITLRGINSGVYLIRIVSNKGIATLKFVKE
jgi:hypothetical protein